MSDSSSGVQLCFLEKPDDPLEAFDPQNQPSKVGGKPVWLIPDSLPDPSILQCGQCKEPMIFLLQLYLPIETNPNAFHRTVYIFCCRNANCQSIQNGKLGFKVLRCQLPEENPYYSENQESTIKPANTCFVCGQLGDKVCGQCKKVYYCSRQHQQHHWTVLDTHKNECKELQQDNTLKPRPFVSNLLFPEYEIVSDNEPELDPAKEEEIRKKTQKMISRYQRKQGKQNDKGNEDEDWSEVEHNVELDKAFEQFQITIAREPSQVIRFDSEQPLWVSSNGQPSPQDIPACELCGAERKFEFQVLPQMLFYIDKDKLHQPIDWGTLAIYTCSRSCENSDSKYVTEFLWRQDPYG